MRCVVTAGPSYEPLDQVRRLTNFSTGRLGCELARFLTEHGHEVLLLLGEQATYAGPHGTSQVRRFSTAESLSCLLRGAASQPIEGVFHAAAVSDFGFGKVWRPQPDGGLKELSAGKLSTRDGRLLVELVPTPKLIKDLRAWFPQSVLVGWKYQVDGDRAGALAKGKAQISECGTDACVVNGPAYGAGFGVANHQGILDCPERPALFAVLERILRGAVV